MLRNLRTVVLVALSTLLLASCLGWARGYGPRHGRWSDDRPYVQQYQCTDPQTGQPARPPCPYSQ